MAKVKSVGFVLLGCGKLGSGIIRVWEKNRQKIIDSFGIDLQLRHVLVKHPEYRRGSGIEREIVTSDLQKILKDKRVDIAIDAIGGIEPTYSILRSFLEQGVHLVSANRALLAAKMSSVFKLAKEKKLYLRFDAALGSGVPIIRTVRRDLIATNIKSMWGIVSGSSNLILSEMHRTKKELKKILEFPRVQKLAESHMLTDYEGTDAAQKLALLAGIAFNSQVSYIDVYAEGLAGLNIEDFHWAEKFGYEFKYMAFLHEHEAGIELRAHPTLVSKGHPLISVRDEYNAYYFQTDSIGELMFYGKGAGILPAATVVIRDLVTIAVSVKRAGDFIEEFSLENKKPLLPIDEIYSGYYARFPCEDVPGVIGKITTIFGEHNININSAHASVEQEKISKHRGGFVHIFIDHAQEKNFKNALRSIDDLQVIKGKVSYFRILSGA